MERETALREMARLQETAEKAYDEMYDAHSWGIAYACYDMAYDCLRQAESLAREQGLGAEADALAARAHHIRKVYRHQFMQPPDLS